HLDAGLRGRVGCLVQQLPVDLRAWLRLQPVPADLLGEPAKTGILGGFHAWRRLASHNLAGKAVVLAERLLPAAAGGEAGDGQRQRAQPRPGISSHACLRASSSYWWRVMQRAQPRIYDASGPTPTAVLRGRRSCAGGGPTRRSSGSGLSAECSQQEGHRLGPGQLTRRVVARAKVLFGGHEAVVAVGIDLHVRRGWSGQEVVP